jgi:hypothetical protein
MKPVIFNEDSTFYKELSDKFVSHKSGLFIFAPSGAGKSHYCRNQNEKHWIDGDELWMGAHAHPEFEWWLEDVETINRIDKRSDVITMEAMYQGFWIMGASNFWLKPNAIVLPKWDDHIAFIKHREENNYDGGAKSDDLEGIHARREVIRKWHTDHGVPLFESIDEAVTTLTQIV